MFRFSHCKSLLSTLWLPLSDITGSCQGLQKLTLTLVISPHVCWTSFTSCLWRWPTKRNRTSAMSGEFVHSNTATRGPVELASLLNTGTLCVALLCSRLPHLLLRLWTFLIHQTGFFSDYLLVWRRTHQPITWWTNQVGYLISPK